MPEHPSRPTFKIADNLEIERRIHLAIECASCSHQVIWSALDLERRFKGNRGTTLQQVAPRLKCAMRVGIRDNWGRGP